MNLQQKPTLVNIIAWMTLASGITNLFWGFAASGTALATIVGVVCLPLTILPTILGVFELIYAAKLFSNPAQPINPSTNLAIFEIACFLAGNVFSMVVGILALVFYNDTVVKEYFARLNGTLAPIAATTVPPVTLPDPAPFDPVQDKPAPVMEELPHPVEEPSTPPAPEPPAKPKRGPRKVA